MVALVDDYRQGYYSILRWRRNVARDEARNVAVLLVDDDGQMGGIRHAPVSSISARLQVQGLLDAILSSFQQRFAEERKPTIDDLRRMENALQRSLYLTPPTPTAVTDIESVLSALYKALVSPRSGGSSVLTKGRVLDRVVASFRKQGFAVSRGQYIDDFLFDAVIDTPEYKGVVEVLSFANAVKNWTSMEYDVGHFLYALRHVDHHGLAVIQPPTEATSDRAEPTYKKVVGWLNSEHVPTISLEELAQPQLALPL